MKNEPIVQKRPKKNRNSAKKRNFNLLIFVLFFLGVIVAVPYYFLVPKEVAFKLQQYEQAKVVSKDFLRTVSAKGKVIAGTQKELTAFIEGTVEDIFVKPGDRVKKGDVLMQFASESLEEDLKKAVADYQQKLTERGQYLLDHKQNLKQLDQQIQEAENLYQRLTKQLPTWKKLFELGEISKFKFEDEQKNLHDALLTWNGAKESKEFAIEKYDLKLEEIDGFLQELTAQVEELRELMQATRILAEIDGKVVNIPVQSGDELQKGKTVVEIIDEGSFLVKGEVPMTSIKSVEVGQKVQIDTGAAKYTGEVAQIAAVAKESVVEIDVMFEQIPNDLRPQTAVTLGIEIGEVTDALALPRGRYLSSGHEMYVYKIEDEKAYKTRVTFGLVNGNYIQVKSGLEEGDQVITSSYDNFIQLDEIVLRPEGGTKI